MWSLGGAKVTSMVGLKLRGALDPKYFVGPHLITHTAFREPVSDFSVSLIVRHPLLEATILRYSKSILM